MLRFIGRSLVLAGLGVVLGAGARLGFDVYRSRFQPTTSIDWMGSPPDVPGIDCWTHPNAGGTWQPCVSERQRLDPVEYPSL